MKVLMLGGTTFFGKAIVEELLARGHQVAILTRGRRRPAFWDRVERLQGDRRDGRSLRGLLRNKEFDAVIDNIAFRGEDVASALAALEGRVGRYVLTSTASVRWIPARNEAAPQGGNAGWGYELGKLEAERALSEQSRVPYTIMRPSVVLGPDEPDLRGFFYFQRLLDGKPLLLTDGGTRAFPLVYSGDLARAYCLALGSARAENQTYAIAPKEPVTVAAIVRTAARGLGLEPRTAAISSQALRGMGFDYPEPYARESGSSLDAGKAERELGFAGTPLAEWISRTALWYRDVYEGPDSAGYSGRQREVEIAALCLRAATLHRDSRIQGGVIT